MTGLSVLTFNAGLLKVQVLGFTVFENPQFAAERLPLIGASLSSVPVLADFVCLQEVYTDADAAVIQRALEKTHPHVVRVSDSPTPLPKLHNGLMILSRWPIAQGSVVLERFVDASRAEQWMGNKSILKASFQVPDLGPSSLVTIMTSHLTSGGEHPESDAPSVDEVRGAELVQLRRFAEAAAAKGDIVIIAGDFNCGPSASEENYRSLLDWTVDTYVAARDVVNPVTPACTWDPTIYLNRTNIHAACPANRLDLVLVVPHAKWRINVDSAAIILTEPCVPVSSSSGDALLVTLSDHYGYRSSFSLSSSKD